MNADERIAARLNELIEAGDRVLGTQRSPPQNVIGAARVDSQLAMQWATSSQSLLARVFGDSSAHFTNFVKSLGTHISYYNAVRAQGVLRAAADDLAGGHLVSLHQLIEAEILDDFLEQSEQLLASGYFQAAAVVAGCVLEDSLRILCVRNSIQLSGRPKLNKMNSDFAKAGVYTKLVQKRVTVLADLRNKAAHGEWSTFERADVEEMVKAVRRLVEEWGV